MLDQYTNNNIQAQLNSLIEYYPPPDNNIVNNNKQMYTTYQQVNHTEGINLTSRSGTSEQADR